MANARHFIALAWLLVGVPQAKAQDAGIVPAEESASHMTVQEMANAAYQKCKSAKSAEDFTAIIDLCNAGLRHDVDGRGRRYLDQLSAWAYDHRGQVYADLAFGQRNNRRAGVYEAKALADFEKAVERNPERLTAIHNRGVSYALAGMYGQALEDFDRVLNLNPRHASAWFNQGEIHYQREEFERAIGAYDSAIAINAQDARRIWAACARYRLGDYRQALLDYRKAIELDDAGRLDAARAALGRALEAATRRSMGVDG